MRNPGMLIVGRALRRLISNPAPLLSGLGARELERLSGKLAKAPANKETLQ